MRENFGVGLLPTSVSRYPLANLSKSRLDHYKLLPFQWHPRHGVNFIVCSQDTVHRDQHFAGTANGRLIYICDMSLLPNYI